MPRIEYLVELFPTLITCLSLIPSVPGSEQLSYDPCEEIGFFFLGWKTFWVIQYFEGGGAEKGSTSLEG